MILILEIFSLVQNLLQREMLVVVSENQILYLHPRDSRMGIERYRVWSIDLPFLHKICRAFEKFQYISSCHPGFILSRHPDFIRGTYLRHLSEFSEVQQSAWTWERGRLCGKWSSYSRSNREVLGSLSSLEAFVHFINYWKLWNLPLIYFYFQKKRLVQCCEKVDFHRQDTLRRQIDGSMPGGE